MDLLKMCFPLSFKLKDVMSLVVAIVIYLVVDLIDLVSQSVQFHISLSPCFVFQPCVEDGDGGGGLDDGDRPGHDAWVVPSLDFQCGNFPRFQIHGLLGL